MKLKTLEELRDLMPSIAAWHLQTFKGATLDGQLDKFFEEVDETYNAEIKEDAIVEMADSFIVACGIFNFHERLSYWLIADIFNAIADSDICTPEEFIAAVLAKMEINKARDWSKSGDGKYQHKES